jgi:hypothetical protein
LSEWRDRLSNLPVQIQKQSALAWRLAKKPALLYPPN